MKRGPLWERTLVLWLQAHGWPQSHRLMGQGANDCGDIDGVGDWLIQAKNTGVVKLGETCAAAAVQAKRAGKARWACIWKRRNHGVAQAYVVMEVAAWSQLAAVESAARQLLVVVDEYGGVLSSAELGYQLAALRHALIGRRVGCGENGEREPLRGPDGAGLGAAGADADGPGARGGVPQPAGPAED